MRAAPGHSCAIVPIACDLTGPPVPVLQFQAVSNDTLKKKILTQKLKIPNFVTKEARSLLNGLLTREPEQRLGYGATGSEVRGAMATHTGIGDVPTVATTSDCNWMSEVCSAGAFALCGSLEQLGQTGIECFGAAGHHATPVLPRSELGEAHVEAGPQPVHPQR